MQAVPSSSLVMDKVGIFSFLSFFLPRFFCFIIIINSTNTIHFPSLFYNILLHFIHISHITNGKKITGWLPSSDQAPGWLKVDVPLILSKWSWGSSRVMTNSCSFCMSTLRCSCAECENRSIADRSRLIWRHHCSCSLMSAQAAS